jgi:multisubunit Na+/H+ antiporter MnhB subunit
MNAGMTPIVQNTTRLVTGFIAVFGIYVAATGHLGPGGGFAGGVILASAGILIVLAFGRRAAASMLTEPRCHVWDAAGALGFLAVAVLGYFAGSFFLNFINVLVGGGSGARLHRLFSAGTIPLSNLAILVKVAAGLAGGFLALSALRGRSGSLEVRP